MLNEYQNDDKAQLFGTILLHTAWENSMSLADIWRNNHKYSLKAKHCNACFDEMRKKGFEFEDTPYTSQ